MKPVYFSVDVLMERVPLANRWVSEQWRPAAVVPIGETEANPGDPECIADGPEGTTWRFPGRAVELHPSEAEGYYLNITSETPLVFVMWRASEDGGAHSARRQPTELLAAAAPCPRATGRGDSRRSVRRNHGPRAAAAGRVPHHRIRLRPVHATGDRRGNEARRAEEAVQRSIVQRDGRSRHLRGRLHAARSHAPGNAGKAVGGLRGGCSGGITGGTAGRGRDR